MNQAAVAAGEIKDQAHEAVREASPWLTRFGRFGFAVKGVVYAIVGGLAGLAAMGLGGETTDTEGAIETLALAPFGKLLLAIVVVGLLGYALWRFVQAAFDTECKGTEPKGLWARGAYVVIGCIYLGLALSTADALVPLPLSEAFSGGGDSTQDWTAWLLGQPFGRWLAVGAGGLVLFAGLFQFYRAATADFCEKLMRGRMGEALERWAIRLGRLGFAARGVAFTIIGGFIALAAIRADPQEARGLGGALDTLAGAPFGPWLLGAVALGLFAYGLYMFFEARYRRMVIR